MIRNVYKNTSKGFYTRIIPFLFIIPSDRPAFDSIILNIMFLSIVSNDPVFLLSNTEHFIFSFGRGQSRFRASFVRRPMALVDQISEILHSVEGAQVVVVSRTGLFISASAKDQKIIT